MLVKCPSCGIEYSYGRKICHICKDHTLYHGKIFMEEVSYHVWNCNFVPKLGDTNNRRLDSLNFKTITNKNNNDFRIEERTPYDWNCDSALKFNHYPLNEKQANCILMYE
jgi:hypothetical protein